MNYELHPADGDSARRIVEVVFYLLLNQVYSNKSTSDYETKQLVESLSVYFGCKPTTINMAYQNMLALTHAPSPTERVIALKYIGLPVRTIQRLVGIHQNTVYRYLKDYIENGQLGLAPRFDTDTDRQLLKFNKQMVKTFGPLNEILNVKEADKVWR